jgi:DNA polymerase II small subunit/DNA polymerase delta subunit B
MVVDVRRRREAAPHFGLKVMLTHETADLLVIEPMPCSLMVARAQR